MGQPGAGSPSQIHHRRQLQPTGHRKNTAVLSEITDAIMNLIGKVGCGIEGISVAESFDATCIHESQNVTEIGETDTVPIYQMLNEYTTYQPLSECAEMAIAAPSTQSCIGTTPPSSHCSCHECGSISRLKKRKLELEVAILAKRFEKEQ